MIDLDLIRKLVEAWGPSGFEHQVRALIRAEVESLADEVTVDGLGNLICRMGSGGTKVMIAAHMDEIGVMATYVEPASGYVRFAAIGGLIQSTLTGSRVRFEDGTLGVVCAPDYFGTARQNAPDVDLFYIDVQDGGSEAKVQPGSPAIFHRTMEVRGSRILAKSLDDRIGCAVAIETMRRLKAQGGPQNEVYFAFTVQEEVGIRGARPAAYRINPDLAIALDVTSTGDMVKAPKMAVTLGGGAAIKLHDTGLVVPPLIRDWMIAAAEAGNIPHQRELLTLGTTDAAAIQVAHEGVPSGCISIPCRFVHTQSETVDTGDVEACITLLTRLLREPANVMMPA